MSYHLSGRFIECCNCKVVCPCWVDDTPTEDHCAGFFAWTFDEGSTIDGQPVGGRHVVVVTVHSDPARGGTSESVIFVEQDLDPTTASALVWAYSMNVPDRTDPLADLRSVLGYPVAWRAVDISVGEVDETLDVAKRRATGLGARALRRVLRAPGRYPRRGYRVRVSVPGASGGVGEPLVQTILYPEYFDDSGTPLRLTSTALDAELRVQGVVTAHRTENLLLRVAALAGAGTELSGRSGMVGDFRYDHVTDAGDAPGPAQWRDRGRGGRQGRGGDPADTVTVTVTDEEPA